MFSGIVIKGKQIARQIGFPTANVSVNHSVKSGIYCGLINEMKCIIYINNNNLIECHIPGFEGDLYDQEVNVTVLQFIRDHVDFECLDQVVTQIKKDLVIYNLFNLFNSVKDNNSTIFVSFSGGKESCVIIDLLYRCNINFDVVHFKPINLENKLLPFMKKFLEKYSKEMVVEEYSNFEDSVKKYDNYSYCYLGVRKSDKSFKNDNWLSNCKIIKPLFDLSYSDVWDYIDNFNVEVSELYSIGYTSVGYSTKQNILLKKFGTEEYFHAKNLKNIDSERKFI